MHFNQLSEKQPASNHKLQQRTSSPPRKKKMFSSWKFVWYSQLTVVVVVETSPIQRTTPGRLWWSKSEHTPSCLPPKLRNASPIVQTPTAPPQVQLAWLGLTWRLGWCPFGTTRKFPSRWSPSIGSSAWSTVYQKTDCLSENTTSMSGKGG